jgi:hypothetical protein
MVVESSSQPTWYMYLAQLIGTHMTHLSFAGDANRRAAVCSGCQELSSSKGVPFIASVLRIYSGVYGPRRVRPGLGGAHHICVSHRPLDPAFLENQSYPFVYAQAPNLWLRGCDKE